MFILSNIGTRFIRDVARVVNESLVVKKELDEKRHPALGATRGNIPSFRYINTPLYNIVTGKEATKEELLQGGGFAEGTYEAPPKIILDQLFAMKASVTLRASITGQSYSVDISDTYPAHQSLTINQVNDDEPDIRRNPGGDFDKNNYESLNGTLFDLSDGSWDWNYRSNRRIQGTIDRTDPENPVFVPSGEILPPPRSPMASRLGGGFVSSTKRTSIPYEKDPDSYDITLHLAPDWWMDFAKPPDPPPPATINVTFVFPDVVLHGVEKDVSVNAGIQPIGIAYYSLYGVWKLPYTLEGSGNTYENPYAMAEGYRIEAPQYEQSILSLYYPNTEDIEEILRQRAAKSESYEKDYKHTHYVDEHQWTSTKPDDAEDRTERLSFSGSVTPRTNDFQPVFSDPQN